MLRSILDLGDLTVEDVMTHRGNMTLIDAGQPASVILDQVLSSPFTRIPLYRVQPANVRPLRLESAGALSQNEA